jgi:2-keto-4-pentenoate hydratase
LSSSDDANQPTFGEEAYHYANIAETRSNFAVWPMSDRKKDGPDSMVKMQSAADSLWAARQFNRVIPPISATFGIDGKAAYEVQDINTKRSISEGRIVSGRKIGLTSPAAQTHFGVDEPDYGILFEDMGYNCGSLLPFDRLIQPRGETEIALVMKTGLSDTKIDFDSLLDAVDYVTVAIEIVDSAIENWNLTVADTVADNASAAMYVLGTERIAPRAIPLETAAMRTFCNGKLVATGMGANCLGSPYLAALWLARKLAGNDLPLKAGDVILTGSLGPMYDLGAGDHVVAEIEDFGSVKFHLSS